MGTTLRQQRGPCVITKGGHTCPPMYQTVILSNVFVQVWGSVGLCVQWLLLREEYTQSPREGEVNNSFLGNVTNALLDF